MSACLLDSYDRQSSDEAEAQQGCALAAPAEAVELSSLARNFRALNLLVAGGRIGPEPAVLRTIALDEVAWHDTLDDCWIVVYDYVYDVTGFMASHPGGQDVLLEYAGRDASLAFVGSGHSRAARRILDKYLIGELPKPERIFRTSNGIKIGDLV